MITDDTRREDYIAAASQTVFPFSFEILESAELKVYVDNVLQAEGTDYTVTGAGGLPAVDAAKLGPFSGNVTFTDPMAGGEAVLLNGNRAYERDTDLATGQQTLIAKDLNHELNALAIQDQQLARDVSRCLHPPIYDVAPNFTLPAVATRKGKFLRFADPSGDPEVSEITTTGTVLSQSVIAGYLTPQTPAEIAAGVTPTFLHFEPGVIDRYGNNVNPGVTDMTTATQSAIDQAGQAGGAPVVALAATYLISSELTGVANISLLGQGQGVSIIKAAASYPQQNMLGFAAKDNIFIAGITFDMNVAAGTPNLGSESLEHILLFTSCSNVRIRDCEFTGAYNRMIRLNGSVSDECENIWIEANYLHDGSQGGIQLRRYGRNVHVEENVLVNTVDTTHGGSAIQKPLAVNGTIGTWIERNTVLQTNGDGGSLIVEYIDRAAEDVHIIGNRVQGNGGGNNIKVGGADGVTLRGNSCLDANNVGIYIEGCSDVDIDGNKIRDAQQNSIVVTSDAVSESSLDSQRVTIRNNKSRNANRASAALGSPGADGSDNNSYHFRVVMTGFDLVTNGDFATDTDWTKGAGWTIGSGVATATAASSDLEQTLVIHAGKEYDVTFTTTHSAGSVTPNLGGTAGAAVSSAGTFTQRIKAGSSNSLLEFTGAGFSGTLDNVSVGLVVGKCQIIDNELSDDNDDSNGISINTPNHDIIGNDFLGLGSGVISIRNRFSDPNGRRHIKDNAGARTIDRGTADILNGNSSVTVSPNIIVEGTGQQFSAVPAEALNGSAAYWNCAEAANETFDIQLRNSSHALTNAAADITFHWVTDVSRVALGAFGITA